MVLKKQEELRKEMEERTARVGRVGWGGWVGGWVGGLFFSFCVHLEKRRECLHLYFIHHPPTQPTHPPTHYREKASLW